MAIDAWYAEYGRESSTVGETGVGGGVLRDARLRDIGVEGDGVGDADDWAAVAACGLGSLDRHPHTSAAAKPRSHAIRSHLASLASTPARSERRTRPAHSPLTLPSGVHRWLGRSWWG